ncbi:MAG: hypothetical protein K8U57_05360 [Planctomycetes bacterium]|nr:hypothetical protein [Planctomycetota bacterium]
MHDNTERKDVQEVAAEQPSTNAEQPVGWEEVEAGRFMPRRTRGSCIGLALG